MKAFLQARVDSYQSRLAAWLRVGLVLAWALLIWFLSSRTTTGLPSGVVVSYVGNSGHVVVFGVLAGLILLSTKGCTLRASGFAVVLAVAYGVVDEWHQGFVKGRTMDPWDVCSDGLGACIAVCALLWLSAGSRSAGWWSLILLVPAAGSVHMAASSATG